MKRNFRYSYHVDPNSGCSSWGPSMLAWLKELFVDIISSLFPGLIFTGYLIFVIVSLIIFKTGEIPEWVKKPDLLHDSYKTIVGWSFVAFSFMSGFILQRMDIEDADFISQILKSCRKRTMSGWALPVVFLFCFAFLPVSVIVRCFNYYIYRSYYCCGLGSKTPGAFTNIQKLDEREHDRMQEGDGLLKTERNEEYLNNQLKKIGRKSEVDVDDVNDSKLKGKQKKTKEEIARHNAGLQQTTPWWKLLWRMIVKCAFNPGAAKEDEYVWRKCPETLPESGSNCVEEGIDGKKPFQRCENHRRKLTKYPYEDYYHCYLKSRGLSYLEPYIVWDKWNKLDGMEKGGDGSKLFQGGTFEEVRNKSPRTKRIIDLLKLRIRAIQPEATEELVRVETHIRLSSAIWYLTQFIGKVSALSIVFLLLLFNCPMIQSVFNLFDGQHVYNAMALREMIIYLHVCVFLVAAFLNYSVSGFLHYIRLKEISFIIDWARMIHGDPKLSGKFHWEDFDPDLKK